MKRSKFTEEQIIAILKEHEAGAKTADLCRKHGMSDATFYNWKAKYGGMDVSEAKRLKSLEEENDPGLRLFNCRAAAQRRGHDGRSFVPMQPLHSPRAFRSIGQARAPAARLRQ
jgi:putative transposase